MSWTDDLPPVLIWTEKPDLIVGDLIVFKETKLTLELGALKWAADREGQDGITVPTNDRATVPAEYLKITHVGRHRRGYWFARYTVHGTDRVEYLARGHGTTTNPSRSIDPDAPVMKPTETDREHRERSQRMSEVRQLQQVRQRLGRELTRAQTDGVKARVMLAIAQTEKQIETLTEPDARRAA